ncbi:hypothetical protein CHARACLAT_012747 [Characodon lateralis]|uniref:Secreted protein n=1 Tax=Characodon lateralis TaxID=208331 RepID=A0ABU7CRW9_9TELE|nr:hypothetical protein [Characodon lateralis]
MYVPLVCCLNFIRICVFLLSKRITVFLIYFSLISFYNRATPTPFLLVLLCFYLTSFAFPFKSVSSQTAAKHLKKPAAACLFLRDGDEQDCCQQSRSPDSNGHFYST